MYKIFMLIALPLLAIGWIAYAIWVYKVREEEKKQPRQVSQRLKKSRSEVAEWAQKLKEFKKPTGKPTDQTGQGGQMTENR
jgi:predicted membrane protein